MSALKSTYRTSDNSQVFGFRFGSISKLGYSSTFFLVYIPICCYTGSLQSSTIILTLIGRFGIFINPKIKVFDCGKTILHNEIPPIFRSIAKYTNVNLETLITSNKQCINYYQTNTLPYHLGLKYLIYTYLLLDKENISIFEPSTFEYDVQLKPIKSISTVFNFNRLVYVELLDYFQISLIYLQ